MPRDASSWQAQVGTAKLTFYRQFCTFVEKCVTSPPTDFTLFSCFVKNKNKQE